MILGIDPGLHGALALYAPLADNPHEPMLQDMPLTDAGAIDAFRLSEIVNCARSLTPACGPLHAVIENVSSRPRQQGAFAFGLYTGILNGVLGALSVPFTLISPAQWKPAMGLRRRPDETTDQNKTRARQLATQLFPALAPQFKRVKDDGRAEALLLAVYYASTLRELK